jgi:hypothetical protein
MAWWLTSDVARWGRLLRAAALIAVVFVFAGQEAEPNVLALQGERNPAYECAKDLKPRLDAAGLPGPVASVGLGAAEVGLYLGFLRDEPWYGNNIDPTPQDFKALPARLYIVVRHSPMRERLDAQEGLQNADAQIFASPADAEACPVLVYAARQPHGSAQ